MTEQTTHRTFTGRHMTMILIAFFGVIIAVNLMMARFAMSTFGGKVVENSYVASQHYNDWLALAAAQDRLGWKQEVAIGADRHLRLGLRKDGAIVDSVRLSATLSHPLGRAAPRDLRVAPVGDGSFRSVEPLPDGRWRLDLIARRGADEARYRMDLQ